MLECCMWGKILVGWLIRSQVNFLSSLMIREGFYIYQILMDTLHTLLIF